MNKKDLLYSYIKGFKCGVSMSQIDTKFMDHISLDIASEYRKGYEDGRRTKQEHVEAAENRLGVKLDILRTQPNHID